MPVAAQPGAWGKPNAFVNRWAEYNQPPRPHRAARPAWRMPQPGAQRPRLLTFTERDPESISAMMLPPRPSLPSWPAAACGVLRARWADRF